MQGDGAAEDIVAALKYFNRKQLVDVIFCWPRGGDR